MTSHKARHEEVDDDPGWVPISDHGLIGDLRTAALVGSDGTIDWFCAPRFDSPSVFGAVLDRDEGGCWQLAPVDGSVRSQQFYLPESAILATRFLTEDGVVEVHDFMPILKAHDPEHRQRLVRRVTAVRGTSTVAMRLSARPDYAREKPRLKEVDGGVLVADGEVELVVSATCELIIDGDDVTATVELAQGASALFVLEVLAKGQERQVDVVDDTDELFSATSIFWRQWLAQSRYAGRWREMVDRSAITLKLLTHEPSGAVVAAPTTSLPERIGGSRNWDYRYVWMRDAAFSLYALLRLGFLEEAEAFIGWLSDRLRESVDDERSEELGPIRVLYDIDGRVPTDEHELDHLSGYRDSSPVRVGNAAVDQLQLDIYGELIDSIYLFNKYGTGLSHDVWTDLTRVIDWLVDNWDRDDAGMWESRADPQAHTTSRVMCWVAVERMMRVSRQRGLPGDLTRWAATRDAIYASIMDDCWNEELGSFTQVAGGEALDAGALLMPMVKLMSPTDPRFLSTVKAVEERLVSDTLVFRYDPELVPDGVGGEEGTFSLCSFWYVEALTRSGRLDEAQLALEKMFTYANHVGLYAEQIGATGDQLGNFPQAFTHLSLISAAINLDHALG